MIRKNAEMLIVEPIQKRMRENGFSEKIVQNTYLREIQFKSKTKVRLIFSSVLFADTGYDIALGREKGTKRHKVAPSKKKSLHWIAPGGQSAFSKGHEVDGVPPLKIIETIIDERTEIFQMAYDRDLSEWVQKNMSGVEGYGF